jgi:predicted nucleotidyltransferase
MDGSHSTVDVLLDDLVASIEAVLGDELVGIYLYGSYVSGGFDPGVSDLDLVAVTGADVDVIDLGGLERMHGDFIGRHPDWTDRIEVVYVGLAALRSFGTSPGPLAVTSPGEPFHLRDEPLIDWLQNWYLIRETGVALVGPPAAAIVPPIAWSEFVAAAARYAAEISDRSLSTASAGSAAYAVLTMCRAFMTVAGQEHGSKQAAAAWTRERLPEWAWLIDAALACRLSRGMVGFDDERTRAAAQTLVGIIAAEIRERATTSGGLERG